jgi:hypothetical protein
MKRPAATRIIPGKKGFCQNERLLKSNRKRCFMEKCLFILSVILLVGCEIKEKDNAFAVEIDIHQAKKKNISEFVDSVRYIKLQTTKDNLIGYISKVFFTDDRIIVEDSQAEQILIFDNKGIFLDKIRRKGQGPGEYTNLSRSLYDPVHKIIMMYGEHKMLFYNLNGENIREISNFNNNAIIRDIINLPNGNFLCYTYDLSPEKVGNEASGLWEVDNSGNFIRSFFTYEKLYPIMHTFSNSYFTLLPQGKIGLRDAVFDGIYHYENGRLRKYISYEVKNNNRYKYEGTTFIEENFITSLSSQDKGNYIFTKWTDLRERFCSVFSKKDQTTVLIYPMKNFWVTNNLVVPVNFDFIDSNKSEVLLTAISGDAILNAIKENNISPEIKETLRKTIEEMEENEIVEINPVLQLLYIK